MIMWTIQPYSVYLQLKETGVFSYNPQKSENLKDPSFQFAYH
jgi:hypothetical protein